MGGDSHYSKIGFARIEDFSRSASDERMNHSLCFDMSPVVAAELIWKLRVLLLEEMNGSNTLI
jgi:hypothetical protein